jgi:hypothetical protein
MTPDPTAAPAPENDWERDSVFRETFLEVLPPAAAAPFRAFGEVLFNLALEYRLPVDAAPADVLAAELRAVAADLRFLGQYMSDVSRLEEEDEGSGEAADREERQEGDEEGGGSLWDGPRQRRWRRFGARLAERLGGLADEIETELAAAREDHV